MINGIMNTRMHRITKMIRSAIEYSSRSVMITVIGMLSRSKPTRTPIFTNHLS